MLAKGLVLLFMLYVLPFAQDLYTELLKEQISSIPLNKAVTVGKGKNTLIAFINPDCPHCRDEWSKLKAHLNKIKVHFFLVANPKNPSNWAKASYIACSKEKYKVLDEVLTGKYDQKTPPISDCPLVYEHLKVAENLNVRAVPYNIIPKKYKIIEGNSPLLLKELGIN